ncbi:MAG: carbamoyl-phosphate synthase large subunit, partial [Candidatus ainarchaeum sp.]|nr:carbamoyl-phosphate synthase large subunit [Candidatus ainarchaeum sp.]
LACFEPAIDYVVVKIPRWPFDKMPEAVRRIGTQMKSTGEVMAIGRTFEEALQKAVRSLEVKKSGLELDAKTDWADRETVLGLLKVPTDKRLYAVYAAIGLGMANEEISEASKINPWFIEKIRQVSATEARLKAAGAKALESAELLFEAKRKGFSDAQLARITGRSEEEARKARAKLGIRPVYKMVDTCAAEFEARTPYYYSTYESEDESGPEEKRKVIVIGSGPIRIGQGIEFDYCCCHAAFALREAGVQSIMINNNPETISTDFDSSDKLYFEPLTFEDVMEVIENEKPEGVIVQFGGQTSINLAERLQAEGVRILGTQVEGIDVAEDRERFRELLRELKIPQPANGTARNREEALRVAERVTYPVVVRPSYVIAGRAMQIVYDAEELEKYISEAVDVSENKPVLIDKYIEEAVECEIDGVSDRSRLFIAGIMEHIERAGVHSGDASCVVPPITLPKKTQETIVDYSERISRALNNIGAINVQFAVQNGNVFVLEANPRASRTMPFLSKVTGIQIVKIATKVLLGGTLDSLGMPKGVPQPRYYSVKSPVFPFLKLPGTDIALGPEMKSTGESMGIDLDFGRAYYKSMLSAGVNIFTKGRVALTLNPGDKRHAPEIAREFHSLGFELYATDGTAAAIGNAAPVTIVKKVSEGAENIVEMIRDGEIDMVVNTPTKGKRSFTDGFKIRRAAIESGVPVITTLEAARGIISAVNAKKNAEFTVQPLSSYYLREKL